MKALVIAVLVLATAVYAQAPQNTPPPNRPPAPADAQATPVEPKHSEATANLELAEQKKLNLEMQRQFLIQNANAQIQKIIDQVNVQEKAAAEQQEAVRKENGWGPEVQYIPPQALPDGSTSPGKWQKMPAKKGEGNGK